MKVSTFDRTISSLCWEIDNLKDEVEYWKTKYEQERTDNNNLMNEQMETAKRGVANALMFALSVSDTPEGDLVIRKEDRKALANQFKN